MIVPRIASRENHELGQIGEGEAEGGGDRCRRSRTRSQSHPDDESRGLLPIISQRVNAPTTAVPSRIPVIDGI